MVYLQSLVGGLSPSEKFVSMGRIIPYIMENKNVPNHQPELYTTNKPFP